LDVGQAALLEALAGGERVAPEEGQALLSGALGPGQGGAEQRRSEQGRGAEPRQDLSSTGGHGSVLLSPVSATSKSSIIAWSSCMVLWPCMGKPPVKSRKRIKISISSFSPSRATSLRPNSRRPHGICWLLRR